jgi:hypothetical protein
MLSQAMVGCSFDTAMTRCSIHIPTLIIVRVGLGANVENVKRSVKTAENMSTICPPKHVGIRISQRHSDLDETSTLADVEKGLGHISIIARQHLGLSVKAGVRFLRSDRNRLTCKLAVEPVDRASTVYLPPYIIRPN